MKNTRRIPVVVIVPALLLVLGVFGNSCSQPNNNDAAMYAAYMAALASSYGRHHGHGRHGYRRCGRNCSHHYDWRIYGNHDRKSTEQSLSFNQSI